LGFIVLCILALGFLVTTEPVFTAMPTQSNITCETCPMTVGTEAQEHLMVYDGSGTRHYVECIGCAFKLLMSYDTLRIQTYCDWYGPQYTVTANISQHGAVATVRPTTALVLAGGGCTGNRVAYNQTAAEALLLNGFSEYTMPMMQQPLPATTNTTTIAEKAQTYAQSQETVEPFPFVPLLLAILGVGVAAGSFVAYKKLR
jgi:hypothetical protein